jgi:uncharacterized protein YdcH (DUF465 family)
MSDAALPKEPDAAIHVRAAFPEEPAATVRTQPHDDAPCLPAGAFVFHEEVPMFEGQSQAEIEALMKGNPEFRRLYLHHQELDKKVMDAELGVLPIDDVTLAQMKREKLAAKDRLVRMYDALKN